ncbi:hypothetical protein BC567DRAFT_213554 [Phyllosticta citribraziliensis]
MPTMNVSELQAENAWLKGKYEACKKDCEDEAVKHFKEKHRMEHEIKDLRAERDQLKVQNETLRKQANKPARETMVRFQGDLQQISKDKKEIEHLRERNKELTDIANIAKHNMDTFIPDVKKLVNKVDDAQRLADQIDSGIASMERGRRAN